MHPFLRRAKILTVSIHQTVRILNSVCYTPVKLPTSFTRGLCLAAVNPFPANGKRCQTKTLLYSFSTFTCLNKIMVEGVGFEPT